jgi:hypothetical protein
VFVVLEVKGDGHAKGHNKNKSHTQVHVGKEKREMCLPLPCAGGGQIFRALVSSFFMYFLIRLLVKNLKA